MKSLRVKSRLIFRILAVCLPFALSPAHGQINALKKAVGKEEPAKPIAPETPEEARKRLELWLQEARDALGRLDESAPTAGLPVGITAADAELRRNNLEQMVLTTSRSLKSLNAIDEARKALEKSRADDTAWTGFTEPPPYSILLIDELLNQRDAIQANLTSSKASHATFEHLHTSLVGETKAAEESVNSRILAMQAANEAEREAAKWRLDAARAKSRLLATRAGLMRSSLETLKDRIAAITVDLALIDRKIKAAKANSRFGDEELAAIEKLSKEQKAAAQKEIDVISKRLKSASTARNQSQADLDKLTAATAAPPEALTLAKLRLEVAEGRMDGMQSLIEGLESLIQLHNLSVTAYQERRAFIDAGKPADRARSLESLTLLNERLSSWKNVIDNDISGITADLDNLESRAAAISADDPRLALLNDLRAVTNEKITLAQRIGNTVTAQRKLLRRWVLEFTPDPSEDKPFHRISKLGATAWETLKKIWAFEVTSYENKVEVDGETLTGKVPVTLGMLLRALLFFVIGYWIASLMANRIQSTLVSRGHIVETNARTLRNWVMIVVGVFLAIGTLSFLRIPLTVFAFFGGALAIGLGFGMQTLIKNFISGIIVLAERKIRVGDVLDVDGIIGTVTEVNTRSSIIRGADDVETMIPNSVFLENRVTNWTLSSSRMRRSLRLGVAYGSDPQQVMEILTDSAGRHGLIIKEPAPFAVFEDFGDNALIFSLYFWVRLGGATNPMIVTSDLRLMIEKRLSEAGIGVPYPQRDMHLTTDKPIQVQWSQDGGK
ncbi:MAG: mechanosensitive ion channel [Luteolibacter sp.]|jgi:small-conductance mechanosensitive channel|nr:mechanosensitive ion channel [Luteolibacter sp.]